MCHEVVCYIFTMTASNCCCSFQGVILSQQKCHPQKRFFKSLCSFQVEQIENCKEKLFNPDASIKVCFLRAVPAAAPQTHQTPVVITLQPRPHHGTEALMFSLYLSSILTLILSFWKAATTAFFFREGRHSHCHFINLHFMTYTL